MRKKNPPILLTSSVIAYDTGVALSNMNDRIKFAIESISEWLKIDPEFHIVLCDGSNFDFSKIIKQKFASSNIECIFFENNQKKVKELGRGYGEGEIVKYSIYNSNKIIESRCFSKCSSKLWVDNYKEIIEFWNGKFLCKGVFDNVFSPFRKTHLSYIDTRFYISSCEFYEANFLNSHERVNSKTGYSLEDSFLKTIEMQNLKNILTTIQPIIKGTGGGTGVEYKNSIKRIIKEKIRLKLARANIEFKDLFI
jgi:hypothetical protein